MRLRVALATPKFSDHKVWTVVMPALLLVSTLVWSAAENYRMRMTALTPEQQTFLRVGDSAVLRIPSDHEYLIASGGNVLVPTRRSTISVIYRAVRPGQQIILLTPQVSEGDCISCATHRYFVTVFRQR